MLATFSTRLEARDPEHNQMRAYEVEAGCDPLGDWAVDVRYGRIGTPGRAIR
jgi:predicted DNA-binding WGR domain protein